MCTLCLTKCGKISSCVLCYPQDTSVLIHDGLGEFLHSGAQLSVVYARHGLDQSPAK